MLTSSSFGRFSPVISFPQVKIVYFSPKEKQARIHVLFFPPSLPSPLNSQAGMTDWQVAGGQWSSDPSLPGTGPIVHTGPRHSWLPHVFSLEPCRWLNGVPASLETWQWAGCCVADSHLSGQRLSASLWGKPGPAPLTHSAYPPPFPTST